MLGDAPAACGRPDWARDVPPGVFDRRALDQDRVWITASGEVLRLEEMSTGHLLAVLTWLEHRAEGLHFEAMLGALVLMLTRRSGDPPTAEELVGGLGVGSLSDLRPREWLITTALWRGIQRELRRRGSV